MATLAGNSHTSTAGDNGFFLRAAIAMAVVIVAGFSLQFAMGRSTFAAPLLVHAHAVVFMGWVTIRAAKHPCHQGQHRAASTPRLDRCRLDCCNARSGMHGNSSDGPPGASSVFLSARAFPDLRSHHADCFRGVGDRGNPAASSYGLASAIAFLRHVFVAWPRLRPTVADAAAPALGIRGHFCRVDDLPGGRSVVRYPAHRPRPPGLALGHWGNDRVGDFDRGDHIQPRRLGYLSFRNQRIARRECACAGVPPTA